MHRQLALFASATLGFALTVGCGGSSNADLLGGSGNSSSGGSSGSATGGTGHGTGGTNTGGSSTGASGASSTGGSNTGGNGGSAAGGSGGSGAGGSGGSGAGGSGGSDPGAGVVQCGTSQCKVAGGGTCCVSQQGFDCITSQYCPAYPPAAPITCDGPEDCPGQVCCGTIMQYGGQSFYSRVRCQSNCGQQDERVFCGNHQNACPNGTQCQNSQLLPGFRACG